MVRFLLRLTLIWLVALCFSGLFAQEKQVDNRIWSQVYWRQMLKEGLVAPNPPQAAPAAVYTGSGINASLILTDDSPDVPVTTATNTTQSENSIFANPLDPSKAFNSNNSTTNPVTTLFGANYFMTDDFGQTWGGSVNGAGGTNSGDPATAINLSGRYFVGYISNPGGNGVSYSDDEGQTWVRRTVGPNPGSLADKNHFWVDNSPTSPYQGNLYSAWTDFGGVNDNQVVVSVSTDSGDTWTTRTPVSNGLPGFKQGVHIQTGPDGTVYVTYTVYLSGGVQDEPAYGQTRSTDGGVTWEPAQLIITGTRGIRSSGTSKNMRSNSFPCSAVDISDSPRRGWVYMVWANIGVPGTNNGPGIDVYMIRSEDQGATWSSPIRVNQDPTGLGKEHFLPWITCDPVTGVLAVIYLDDRNVASNQCEVYVSTSLDGGDTWEDVKVSDVAFTPAPIPGLAGGYFGDYISISARGGFAYPCWTDNRQGFAMAYVSPILIADPEKPEDPEELGAYSDYQTPDGMRLTWVDPTAYQLGDTLLASDLRIIISRDGVAIDSVDGGIETYDDAGLVDGTEYNYQIAAKSISTGKSSQPVSARWIAGGSPVPNPPSDFLIGGNTETVNISWTSPSRNVDGTPMDDYAGINLYQDGVLVRTIARASSDTAAAQSESYNPTTPGFYQWQISVIDNEAGPNESVLSDAQSTPLSLPIVDAFDLVGEPSPAIWFHAHTDINDRADSPPSGGLSLNFNGNPVGGDTLELRPVDLTGMDGSGVTLSYAYQPQGTGNAPEQTDSLTVYFLNDLDQWILVRAYEGTALQPFQSEVIELDSVAADSGSFFHSRFQFRITSRGGPGNFINDDWFVDDLVFTNTPVGIGNDDPLAVEHYELGANFPNPFNPSTTIRYQLEKAGEMSLTVYNVLGQQVRTLLRGKQSAGRHQAVWNGTNDAGATVSSGIYFYELRAGSFRAIRKMIFMK